MFDAIKTGGDRFPGRRFGLLLAFLVLFVAFAVAGVFLWHVTSHVPNSPSPPGRDAPIPLILPILAVLGGLFAISSWMVAGAHLGRKAALRAVHRSEVRYRALVEQVPAITYTADLDEKSTTTFISPQIQAILGVSPQVYRENPHYWDQHLHPDDRERVLEEVAHCHESGEGFRSEYRMVTSTGDTVWFRDEAVVVKDEGGSPLFLQGAMMDITERKRAEQASTEALTLFESVIRQSPIPMAVAAPDGTLRLFNQACAEHLGVEDEPGLKQSDLNIFEIQPTWTDYDTEGNPVPPSRMPLQRALQGETIRDLEVRVVRKDGAERWEILSAAPIYGADGALIAGFVAFPDITERKRAEQALRESEGYLESVFRAAPVGIGLVTDRVMNAANKRLCDMLGYAQQDLVGQSTRTLYPTEEDYAYVGQQYTEVWDKGMAMGETHWKRKDGRVIDVLLSATPLDTADLSKGLTFIALDITERKQAEEELRESEEKYRSILENIGEGYYEVNLEGSFTFFNDSTCRMLGYTRDELVGMNYRRYADAEHATVVYQTFNEVFRTGTTTESVDWQLTRSDGTACFVKTSVALMQDSENLPIGFRGIFRDVTGRQRAEEERERLTTAIEQAAETVVITDAEGTVQYANPAFESITGYTREEAKGQPLHILEGAGHEETQYEEMWDTLTRGEVWSGRLANTRKDGERFTEEAMISPVCDASGKIISYVAVSRDVTREIEMEGQLRQSQKMEAVGHLAGGIAHDFNNVLQAIHGYVDLALDGLSPEEELHELLTEIAKAARRASTLTRQLLAFSRRQILHPIHLDLNSLTGDVLKLVRRVIGENIDLAFIPGQVLGMIHADPGQMEQIILNLCINARDAMPDGGTLNIETQNVRIDAEYCRNHSWAKQGRYVLLSISDTGHGMDEETQLQVFEPFFTTKEPGHGTGLGLSTVYGIVKQHHGMVAVYSEEGKGTTFKVYFPLVERRATEVEPVIDGEAMGGTETVLVAEDDETIRSLAVRMLEEGGYTVLVAADGEEAMRLFEMHAGDIDLALLDVVMPKMGGREVFHRLRTMRPNITILFSTGYAPSSVHSRFVLEQNLDLIIKPYVRQSLLRKVREVLDKQPEKKEIADNV